MWVVDAVAIDELEAELAEICGHLNVLHARLVDKVAVALRDKAWFQAGIHTPAQWLAWQTGLSPGRAREIVRLAQLRVEEQFPTVMAAFEDGVLAVDQVAVATKAPAWTDAQMCGLAQSATVAQVWPRWCAATGSRTRHRWRRHRRPESFNGWFDSVGPLPLPR